LCIFFLENKCNAYVGATVLEPSLHVVEKLDALTVLLIAVGLAMDALAVSIAKGITVNKNRRKSAILLASFFGGFQMLMPAVGVACRSELQRNNYGC
jgi:hypothetical protein